MFTAEGPATDPLRAVTRVAGTLDELLANHGQAFIACAYQTLLGRDPDPDGLRFYLAELRNGFSKIQVLVQLRRSEECKTRFRENRSSPSNREEQVLLAQLQREILKFRLARVPLLGWFLKAALGVEGNSAIEIRLRRMEYLLLSSNRIEASPELPQEHALPAQSKSIAGAHACESVERIP